MSGFFRLLILVNIFLISGCSSLCDEKINSSYVSPNGKYVAKLIGKDCGATTSEAISIFVSTNKGESSPNEYDQVMLLDKVKGLSLTWKSDTQISVEYESARIFEFSNFWSDQTNEIEIVLSKKAS